LSGVTSDRPNFPKNGRKCGRIPIRWPFGPLEAALPLGDGFAFSLELGGGFAERFLGFEKTGARFASEPQIRVLSELLRGG
jgi:hypothetical protein